MRLPIIIVLFLLHIDYGKSQSKNVPIVDSIQIICDQIAADSVVEGERIGYGGILSKQWGRYRKLLSISSDSVLLKLTNHPSPTVRGYAYWGLMDRNTDLLMVAIRTNQSDTVLVESLEGCFGYSTPIIQFAVEGTYYRFVHDNKKGLNTTDEEFIKLAHISIREKRQALVKSKIKK